MAIRDDSHYTRIEPWFGNWPPEAKGDSAIMEENTEHKWAQWIPYGAFIFVGLVGGILIASFSKGFWNEIGFALIIAAIIGETIEIIFVRQLAKHVFEIAFGYLLRKEIAEEIRWIYRIDLLVTSYHHVYTFEQCGDDSSKVWVNETITRTVKNIGNKAQDIKPSLGIQEWFHNEGQSEIISYQITHKDGTVLYPTERTKFTLERPKKHKQEHYILAIKEENLDVKLQPRSEYTWVASYRELRPKNADTVFFSYAPSMNPEIAVKIPRDMDYDLTFGNRNQAELCSLGSDQWRLDTLLLPGQAIRLRWWIKSDSEKWKREIDKKYQTPKPN